MACRQTDPPQTFLGPMVALIERILRFGWRHFPLRFKALGLGKLIGKRTWGGARWYSRFLAAG